MLTPTSNTSFTPISVIANSSDINPSTGFAPMIDPTVEQEVLDCWVDMGMILAGDRPSVLDCLKDNCFMAEIAKLQFDDTDLAQLKNKPLNTLSIKEIAESGHRHETMSKKDKAMHKWPGLYNALQLNLWCQEPVDNEQRETARSQIKTTLQNIFSRETERPEKIHAILAILNGSSNVIPDLYSQLKILIPPEPILKSSLDLSGLGLSSLTELLLLALTELNISNNTLLDLNVLPKTLEKLNASDNQLYKIPAAITELTNLKSLNLSNNNLHTLFLNPYYPTGIKQDTLPNSLRSLNISGNPELEGLDYQALPAELIKLDVSGCSINEIELTRLPEKVTIICDGNTTFFVKGEKFTGEKWNGITIQREVSAKPTYQQYP